MDRLRIDVHKNASQVCIRTDRGAEQKQTPSPRDAPRDIISSTRQFGVYDEPNGLRDRQTNAVWVPYSPPKGQKRRDRGPSDAAVQPLDLRGRARSTSPSVVELGGRPGRCELDGV